MITGFRLRVPCAELVKHCRDRAAYHLGRAEAKNAELPKLREAMEQLKAATITGLPTSVSRMTKGAAAYQSTDPEDLITNLEGDIRTHQNKSLVFDYFATHLFEEDYDLGEADLQRLEILR